MDIANLINVFASGITIAIGLVYIIGMMIVTTYLSRFGIAKYQLLKPKYLAVGSAFILLYCLVLSPTVFVAIMFDTIDNSTVDGIFFFVAIVGSFILFGWGDSEPIELGVRTRHSFLRLPRKPSPLVWILGTEIISIFPLTMLISINQALAQNPAPFDSAYRFPFSLLSFSISFVFVVIVFLSSAMFYARHIYAVLRPDFIGMGMPIQVRLVLVKGVSYSVSKLGIRISKGGIAEDLLLLDETDKCYILVDHTNSDLKAIEISKDIVRAIQYLGFQNINHRTT